jgi:hypothetical protein
MSEKRKLLASVINALACGTLIFYSLSDPASSARTNPVQRLRVEVTANGPVIHDLFGRFPSPSANKRGKSSATNCTATQSLPLANNFVSPATHLLQETTSSCVVAHCPFGTFVAQDCAKGFQEGPSHPCGENCNSYTCRAASANACCTLCQWFGGNCDLCLTPGYCRAT